MMRLLGFILAIVMSLLAVSCDAGNESASSQTPQPTAAPATQQPLSPSKELAAVPSGSVLFLTAGGYSDNLYLVGADAGEPKQLLDSAESDSPGAFSPDGKLIAYSSRLRGGGTPDGVYVMSSDGSNPRLVTSGAGDSFVSWGSDGKILYDESTTGTGDYWIVKPDGSDPSAISQMNDCDAPDWSPDGKSLVTCPPKTSPDPMLLFSEGISDTGPKKGGI